MNNSNNTLNKASNLLQNAYNLGKLNQAQQESNTLNSEELNNTELGAIQKAGSIDYFMNKSNGNATQALAMYDQYLQGKRDYVNDASTKRSFLQGLSDFQLELSKGGASGIGMVLTGLGSLADTLAKQYDPRVDPRLQQLPREEQDKFKYNSSVSLAKETARLTNKITDWLDSFISEERKAQRRSEQTLSELSKIGQTFIGQKLKEKGASDFEIGASKVLRGFTDTLANINSAQASELIANSIGQIAPQLMTGGGLSAGLRVLGLGTKTANTTAQLASSIAYNAMDPASQALEEVDSMSIQDLYANSPKFNSLVQDNINKGIPLEQAELITKEAIASEAMDNATKKGLVAATLLSPLDLWMGKSATEPIKKGLAKKLLSSAKDTALEGSSELSQEMASKLIANMAIQNTANVNKETSEGVGEAGALGLIGGVGTPASISIAKGTYNTAKNLKNIKQNIKNKVDSVKQNKEEKEFTSSINNLNEAVKQSENISLDPEEINIPEETPNTNTQTSDINTNPTNKQTDKQKEIEELFKGKDKARNVYDRVNNVFKVPEKFRSKYSNELEIKSATKLLTDLIDKAKNTKDEATREDIDRDIFELSNLMKDSTEITDEEFNELGTLDPSKKTTDNLINVIEVFKYTSSNPYVKNLNNKFINKISNKQDGTTQEGINNILTVASVDPTKVNQKELDKALDPAYHTNTKFTDNQVKALKLLRSFLDKRIKANEEEFTSKTGKDVKEIARKASKYYTDYNIYDTTQYGRDSIQDIVTSAVRAYANNDLDKLNYGINLLGKIEQNEINKLNAFNKSKKAYEDAISRGEKLKNGPDREYIFLNSRSKEFQDTHTIKYIPGTDLDKRIQRNINDLRSFKTELENSLRPSNTSINTNQNVNVKPTTSDNINNTKADNTNTNSGSKNNTVNTNTKENTVKTSTQKETNIAIGNTKVALDKIVDIQGKLLKRISDSSNKYFKSLSNLKGSDRETQISINNLKKDLKDLKNTLKDFGTSGNKDNLKNAIKKVNTSFRELFKDEYREKALSNSESNFYSLSYTQLDNLQNRSKKLFNILNINEDIFMEPEKKISEEIDSTSKNIKEKPIEELPLKDTYNVKDLDDDINEEVTYVIKTNKVSNIIEETLPNIIDLYNKLLENPTDTVTADKLNEEVKKLRAKKYSVVLPNISDRVSFDNNTMKLGSERSNRIALSNQNIKVSKIVSPYIKHGKTVITDLVVEVEPDTSIPNEYNDATIPNNPTVDDLEKASNFIYDDENNITEELDAKDNLKDDLDKVHKEDKIKDLRKTIRTLFNKPLSREIYEKAKSKLKDQYTKVIPEGEVYDVNDNSIQDKDPNYLSGSFKENNNLNNTHSKFLNRLYDIKETKEHGINKNISKAINPVKYLLDILRKDIKSLNNLSKSASWSNPKVEALRESLDLTNPVSFISRLTVGLNNIIKQNSENYLKDPNKYMKDPSYRFMSFASLENNNLALDPRLSQLISIATLSALVDINRSIGSNKSLNDLAEKYDIDINSTEGLQQLDIIYNAIYKDYFLNTMRRYLYSVFNISPNENAYITETQGTIDSLSIAILTVLLNDETLNLQNIQINKIYLDANGQEKNVTIEHKFIGVNYLFKAIYLNPLSDGFEELYTDDFTKDIYLEDELPPVAKTYNHSDVKLNEKQKIGLKNRQRINYNIVLPMANLFNRLNGTTVGQDPIPVAYDKDSKDRIKDYNRKSGLIRLFNDTSLDINDVDNVLNQNTLSSERDRFIVLNKSLETVNSIIKRVQVASESLNKSLDKVNIHFPLGLTIVNRNQELFPFGPIASKLTREVFSSTVEDVDLSIPEYKAIYNRALAQKLGLKIEQLNNAEVEQGLNKIFIVIDKNQDLFNKLLEDTTEPLSDEDVSNLISVFSEAGIPRTPSSLAALVQNEIYKASPKDKPIPVFISIEIDGTTNGIANIIGLLTTSDLNQELLDKLSKVGISIGKGEILEQYRKRARKEGKTLDMYEEASYQAILNIKEFFNNPDLPEEARKELINIFDMYALLGYISFEKGDTIDIVDPETNKVTKLPTIKELKFARSTIKNPVIQINYSAGPESVAKYLVKNLERELYSRFSKANLSVKNYVESFKNRNDVDYQHAENILLSSVFEGSSIQESKDKFTKLLSILDDFNDNNGNNNNIRISLDSLNTKNIDHNTLEELKIDINVKEFTTRKGNTFTTYDLQDDYYADYIGREAFTFKDNSLSGLYDAPLFILGRRGTNYYRLQFNPNFRLSDNLFKLLQDSSQIGFTESIKNSMDNITGASVTRNAGAIAKIAEATTIIYNEKVAFRCNNMIQVNKDNTKDPDAYITPKQIKDIKESESVKLFKPEFETSNGIIAHNKVEVDNKTIPSRTVAKTSTLYSNDKKDVMKPLTDITSTVDIPLLKNPLSAHIPLTNLSSGDGAMMEYVFQRVNDGVTDTFDGLFTSITTARNNSVIANKAVFDSWRENVFKPYADKFETVLNQYELYAQGKYDISKKGIRNVFYSMLGAFRGLDVISEEDLELLNKFLNSVSSDKNDLLFTKNKNLISKLINTARARIRTNVLAIDAFHYALNQMPIVVDHMSGIQNPFIHNSTLDPDLNINELINKFNEFKDQYIKDNMDNYIKGNYPTNKFLERDVYYRSTNKHPRANIEGISQINYTKENSIDFLKRVSSSNDEARKLISLLTNASKDSLKGISVITGSRNTIRDILKASLDPESFNKFNEITSASGKADGVYIPSLKTVFVLNEDVDPFSGSTKKENKDIKNIGLHELLHAVTLDRLYEIYAGTDNPNLSLETIESANQLEEGLKDFINTNFSKKSLGLSSTEISKLENIKSILNNIYNKDDPKARALAVSEYVSYLLGDTELSDTLKSIKLNKNLTKMFVDFIKSVGDTLLSIIFGKNNIDRVKKVLLSKKSTFTLETFLRSNLKILVSSPYLKQEEQETSNLDVVANHLDLPKVNNRILFNKLQEAVVTPLERYIKLRKAKDPNLNNILNNLKSSNKVLENYSNVIKPSLNAIRANGFNLDPEQELFYSYIVNTLGVVTDNADAIVYTNLNKNKVLGINANSLTQITKLKNYTLKQLKNSNDINKQNLYKALTNIDLSTGSLKDTLNRSTTVNNFIALSMVSPEIRDILKDIKLPIKNIIDTKKNLNSLEYFGYTSLDYIKKLISKTDSSNNSLLEKLDSLNNNLIASRIRYLNNKNKTNIFVKTSNFISETEDKLTNKIDEYSSKVISSTDKYSPLFKKFLAASVIPFNRGAREDLYQRGLDSLDRINLFKSDELRSFLRDLLGTNKKSNIIYAQLKKLNAHVYQIRSTQKRVTAEYLRKAFTNFNFTEKQESSLYKAIIKTDIVTLMDGKSTTNLEHILDSNDTLNKAIKDQENILNNKSKLSSKYIDKSKQLAEYLITGKTGNNLLTNAYAIASLLGENNVKVYKIDSDIITAIDKLTTLYALKYLNADERQLLLDIFQKDNKATVKLLNNIKFQKELEFENINNARASVKFNHIKGYSPRDKNSDVSVIVAEKNREDELRLKGFVPSGSIDNLYSYYISKISLNTPFQQGALATIRYSISGVNSSTGIPLESIGLIQDTFTLKRYKSKLYGNNINNTIPVYNDMGELIALRPTVPANLEKDLNMDTSIFNVIGTWTGRKIEETLSIELNKAFIDLLAERWNKASYNDKKEYINVFEDGSISPIFKKSIDKMDPELINYINKAFGEKALYIRRSEVRDMLGQYQASISDFVTGNTNWGPKVQKEIKKIVISSLGRDGFVKLRKIEKSIQSGMSLVRDIVIIRSMIVPLFNILSNISTLVILGVNISELSLIPKKVKELENFIESNKVLIGIEQEIRTLDPAIPRDKKKIDLLNIKKQEIIDNINNLSITPMLTAGELSTIADLGADADDLGIISGDIGNKIEEAINKLPRDEFKTLVKYMLVSRNTELYKVLQKSVQYGDFIAKSILYDHLIKKGKSQEEALSITRDMFVNYDILNGRYRDYLENIGMLWFFNYALRSVKIASYLMLNHPLKSLFISMLDSALPVISDAGSALTDNFITKLLGGSIDYSIGMLESLRMLGLNPVINIMTD